MGADFIPFPELVPDPRNKCLRDMKTKIQSIGNVKETNIHAAKTISGSSVYYTLLAKFKNITKLPDPQQPVKNKTLHNTDTVCPPVIANCAVCFRWAKNS
ncbi:transposon Ty3-G Gag-Pol polyprotein [Trichonephila clavata]|uniref:Transposon Ty3-G Gag-Pol polyprotein n=1 Tax=Trichonephila clavata TaxID=2740835 RepID=A0A8X6FXC6_TRICU|nr:transposon Ty3-G Gag-Pol polyprotein [Trichonephila clavata]